ncbi:MAG: hypothetical protein R3Y21_05785 [Mycoplasmatota bacterium]
MDITNKIKKELKNYFEVLEYTTHEIDEEKNTLNIYVTTTEECLCPHCGKISKSKNTKYLKKVVDLPIDKYNTTFIISTFIFECLNKECSHRNQYFKHDYKFIDKKEFKSKRLIEYMLMAYKNSKNTSDVERKLTSEGIKVSNSILKKMSERYNNKNNF